MPPGDPNGFYLNHGFDRLPSFSGCPYIAEGSSPSSANMLVYAHNMGYGTLGFTELQNCYRTDCFANIGAVTFTNADGNTIRYMPLLGMRVPKNFDLLLRFDFAGELDFKARLTSLAEYASAKSDSSGSDSVITLVTCSSAIGARRSPPRFLVGEKTFLKIANPQRGCRPPAREQRLQEPYQGHVQRPARLTWTIRMPQRHRNGRMFAP